MVRKFPAHFPVAVILMLFVFTQGCKDEVADMLLINGSIHTLNDSDDVVQAIAIRDGKIVGIGTSDDMVFRFEADTTIDLKGGTVYPGFIDAHCHFVGYAEQKARLDLTGTTSFEEVLALVDSFALHTETEWIVGRGWDQNDWVGQDFPTNEALNKRFPDRPVLLKRIDGHAAIANQAALDRAGITRSTRVEGGRIMLSRGKPNGMLIDNAVDLVSEQIPPYSDELRERLLLEAQQDLFSVGLTSVADAGLDLKDINFLDKLQRESGLKLRIYAMANPSEENFDRFLKDGPYQTDRLHVRSFKIYGDGALGSRGACLLEPYKDRPGQYGFMLQPLEYYEEMAQKIHQAGFQMNTHCIGDSANRFILKLYGRVLGDQKDHRWRIEHAQVINPADFNRFATHAIWPSVQPTHATSDMVWSKDRIGKSRLKSAYAYKTLLDQNGKIAFGSDFPVESINPLFGMYAAVARMDQNQQPYGGFNPEQAVSRRDAMRAMTIWAAESCFEEDQKGSLEPGKFADFVILDRDINFCEEKEIYQTKVMMTVVGGEMVFKR